MRPILIKVGVQVTTVIRKTRINLELIRFKGAGVFVKPQLVEMKQALWGRLEVISLRQVRFFEFMTL